MASKDYFITGTFRGTPEYLPLFSYISTVAIILNKDMATSFFSCEKKPSTKALFNIRNNGTTFGVIAFEPDHTFSIASTTKIINIGDTLSIVPQHPLNDIQDISWAIRGLCFEEILITG